MVPKENIKGAKALLAEATGQEIKTIPQDASIETLANWDSLSHMRLILAMEEKIGEELPPEAILGIENLEDIAKYLS